MGHVKLSREGEKKLHEELKHLKEVRRPEVIKSIAEARRKGDLSDNAEYDAAKEEQYKLEHRIHKLEVMLANIEIIDNRNIPSDRAYIGARVDLEDLDSGEEIYYVLVNEYEADFGEKKISTVSPIGKGLLGKKVGEIVEINVPNGTLKYKVKEISR
ncbi:MAG TPA: transcription elongation factor GreA [bacterium]|nr:transcription elongation factor GreA [bacterium]